MTSTEIRAFIAIEAPAEVKSFLNGIIQDLRKSGADVKWVRPEGMHLTLKFLGNISEAKLPLIEQALKKSAEGVGPMRLRLQGLGAFPGLQRPRVVWAGLKDFSEGLAPLAEEVELRMEELGFPVESRRFNPHLTLGRVRSNSGVHGLVDLLKRSPDLRGPEFTADRVILFQSVLKPSGAEYSPLCVVKFGTAGTD